MEYRLSDLPIGYQFLNERFRFIYQSEIERDTMDNDDDKRTYCDGVQDWDDDDDDDEDWDDDDDLDDDDEDWDDDDDLDDDDEDRDDSQLD